MLSAASSPMADCRAVEPTTSQKTTVTVTVHDSGTAPSEKRSGREIRAALEVSKAWVISAALWNRLAGSFPNARMIVSHS